MAEAQSMLSGPTVNFWAVLVAGVAYWIIGAIWYSM